MRQRPLYLATAFALHLLCINVVAVAGDKRDIDAGVDQAIQQFGALNPEFDHLAKEAAGVLVFPHVSKGLAVAGDAFGEGELRIKGKTISYYSITASSVGLSTSAGAPRCDIILFMTQETLNQFTKRADWYIDSRATAATIGKIGRANYLRETLRENVLGFILTAEDLTADASLKSSKLSKLTL